MNQDKIEFFVGILVEDDRKFDNFVKYLIGESIPIEIHDHYDDPDGYYTYVIRGTWKTYNEFKELSVVKSLSHLY